MALVADDAVIEVRPEAAGGTYTGKDAIRQWLESIYADNFHLTINITGVQGDTVSALTVIETDGLKQMGIPSLEGAEQYTVKNGKLAGFTFTYTDASLAQLQAAMTPQTLPQTGAPATPLALWLLLLAGGALVAGTALTMGRAAPR